MSCISLERQYAMFHVRDDLRICIDAMRQTAGNDTAFEFSQYMCTHTDNFAPLCMFIMTPELLDEWCGFVFPLLFKLVELIDVSKRDNYQKRSVCNLCERVFGFWCWKKKQAGVQVAECPIVQHIAWKDNKLNERGTYG